MSKNQGQAPFERVDGTEHRRTAAEEVTVGHLTRSDAAEHLLDRQQGLERKVKIERP